MLDVKFIFILNNFILILKEFLQFNFKEFELTIIILGINEYIINKHEIKY